MTTSRFVDSFPHVPAEGSTGKPVRFEFRGIPPAALYVNRSAADVSDGVLRLRFAQLSSAGVTGYVEMFMSQPAAEGVLEYNKTTIAQLTEAMPTFWKTNEPPAEQFETPKEPSIFYSNMFKIVGTHLDAVIEVHYLSPSRAQQAPTGEAIFVADPVVTLILDHKELARFVQRFRKALGSLAPEANKAVT